MNSLWQKIKNMTGRQYFFLTILTIIVSAGGSKLIVYLFAQYFEVVFLVWLVGLLIFFAMLALYGSVLLFRLPSWQGRAWVWIGVAINFYIVYLFIWGSRLTY